MSRDFLLALEYVFQRKSYTQEHHLKKLSALVEQDCRASLPTFIHTLAYKGSEELKGSMDPTVKIKP